MGYVVEMQDRVSIAETLRQSQLWLRNITADDAIRFIQKASIPQKVMNSLKMLDTFSTVIWVAGISNVYAGPRGDH